MAEKKVVAQTSWSVSFGVMSAWAKAQGLTFVSKSDGQYTTCTVSRDSLVELVEAARKEERTRLMEAIEAKRCKPAFPGGHSFNMAIDEALGVISGRA